MKGLLADTEDVADTVAATDKAFRPEFEPRAIKTCFESRAIENIWMQALERAEIIISWKGLCTHHIWYRIENTSCYII